MKTQDYILNKFGIPYAKETRMPIEIPDFGREQLTELFHELNFKKIVEVGVCKGIFSEVICKNNPQAKVYGVDPFIPHKEYKDYQLKSTISNYYKEAQSLLTKYPNYELIVKMSVDAAKEFKDGSLDAVYLDGNHRYEFVVADLYAWIPKLRKGGIISGHDYAKIRRPTNTHVYEAVNGYTASYDIHPWFLAGTNAVLPGEVRDSLRSWFWCV